MSGSVLAFVCGLLAATSVSLAAFTYFSRRWESSARNPNRPTERPRSAQAIDAGLLHAPGVQGAPPPYPPPYAPAPQQAPGPIYVIAPQPIQIPIQPVVMPPPMPPQMGPPQMGPPPALPPTATRIPPLVRLNDLQLMVHQQQNIFTERWEEYSPQEFPTQNLAFVVFARRQRYPFVPSTLFLLEIHSESLKRVLKGCDCLKYVESVFDPEPQVFNCTP